MTLILLFFCKQKKTAAWTAHSQMGILNLIGYSEKAVQMRNIASGSFLDQQMERGVFCSNSVPMSDMFANT